MEKWAKEERERRLGEKKKRNIEGQGTFGYVKKTEDVSKLHIRRRVNLCLILLEFDRIDSERTILHVHVHSNRDQICAPKEEANNIMRTIADSYIEEGFNKGILQGTEKGIEKGKAELIRMMLNQGNPVDNIAKITGLSVSDIQKLI